MKNNENSNEQLLIEGLAELKNPGVLTGSEILVWNKLNNSRTNKNSYSFDLAHKNGH